MKKSIYVYPMRNKEALKAKSPYVWHLSTALLKYFKVVNYGKDIKGGILDVARYFFKADIFYFNWIENASAAQIFVFIFLFACAKVSGKKIVWAHHNIHPHRNNTHINRYLIKFLAKHADYLVFHTKESVNVLNINEHDSRILCFFHPFFATTLGGLPDVAKEYDLLIWGNVRKSKGVEGFLSFLAENSLLQRYKINITGKFETEEMFNEISTKYFYENITICNKFISPEELDVLHAKARFIFFPYTGSSVLNSGALLTSLPKGIPIIGPNVGGFKEMGEEGFILTYKNQTDVLNYVDKAEYALFNANALLKPFFETHSWDTFAHSLNFKLS